MNKITFSIFALALTLLASPAFADGDAAAGKEKSASCAGCHGADGNSSSDQYPRLAGQYADYIVQALSEYKSGARKNAIMSGFASSLSDQDRADLAAWFSSQGPVLSTPELHKSATQP